MDCEIKQGEVTFEISPMVYAVRLYDSNNSTDYTSSFQCFKYGDVGMAYAITGAGFYRLLPSMLPKILLSLQVSSLQGYVTKAHHRVMASRLKHIADVSILWTGVCANREMVWVRVSLRVHP